MEALNSGHFTLTVVFLWFYCFFITLIIFNNLSIFPVRAFFSSYYLPILMLLYLLCLVEILFIYLLFSIQDTEVVIEMLFRRYFWMVLLREFQGLQWSWTNFHRNFCYEVLNHAKYVHFLSIPTCKECLRFQIPLKWHFPLKAKYKNPCTFSSRKGVGVRSAEFSVCAYLAQPWGHAAKPGKSSWDSESTSPVLTGPSRTSISQPLGYQPWPITFALVL